MRLRRDHRHVTAIITIGIVGLAALLLISRGTAAQEVREVLAITLPPLVAIIASSDRGSGR